MDRFAQKASLSACNTFLLELFHPSLDLTRQAFDCFNFCKALFSQFICRSLDLFDAWRKTTYSAVQIERKIHFLIARFVWIMAAQGLGTSKNSASASTLTPSTANPCETTSLQVDVMFSLPISLNISLVICALCSLNQKVQRCPDNLIVQAIAQEREPEPVPASITIEPGMMFNLNKIAELSIAYKICVLRARVSVIRVDFGFSALMNFPGLLCASILAAQCWLIKFICLKAAPSVVCILLPEMSRVNFGSFVFSNITAQQLSFIRSSYSPWC